MKGRIQNNVTPPRGEFETFDENSQIAMPQTPTEGKRFE
jgi:hypothetical protein